MGNGDRESKVTKPIITYFLISVCLLVFVFEFLVSISGDLTEIFNSYGLSFENIQKGNFLVFITSIFLHGSSSHLFLNIIALLIFGKIVEMELGKKKFLEIFFISSFVGELGILLSVFLGFLPPNVPTIGISAAVFGLMGTAMLIKPFEFIMYPYLIPIPLIFVAILYTIYNIAAFLVVITTDISSNISYISHISGLAAGMFLGLREERSKKGLLALLILLAMFILIPFLWTFYSNIEALNYMNIIANLFK